MRSVPRLCEFNPGICLTTEQKQETTEGKHDNTLIIKIKI